MVGVRKVILGLLFFFCLGNLWAQPINHQHTEAWKKSLPADKMAMGTYYYPEHWPSSRWQHDLASIAAHGFTFTHFAEFAWDRLEPVQGQFNFGWLDSAINIAAKHNLKVVLCTPSATPPAWMSTLYPEILAYNPNGQPIPHGARQHASWGSAKYQFFVNRLATEMGKRYGKDTRIWGWQLDNEPSHYNRYDYSPTNERAFVRWLKSRYVTLARLNKAWGTAFWSVTYSDWEQIKIPNPSLMVQQANPTALLDFNRYTAWSIAQFLDGQGAALRTNIAPSQWITTNYMTMGGHAHADPAATKKLDFVSFTTYPACGNDGIPVEGKQHFRMGDPYGLSLAYDQFRSFQGFTGVMELQPGQTNWGSFNPQPLPGVIRAWLWHSYSLGSRFACNYRFDQPTYGGELHYSAITYPDGKTLRPSGKEWVNTNTEMAEVLSKAKGNAANVPNNGSAAIIAPMEDTWDLNNNKLTEQWHTYSHVLKYYKSLKRNQLPVDFVSEQQLKAYRKIASKNMLSHYNIVVAPSLEIYRPELVKELEQYVINGGHLVLTCRSLQKDSNGHILPTAFSESLSRLAGVEVAYYDALPKNAMAELKTTEGQLYKWNNWGEILNTNTKDIETWATYTDQFYSGQIAVTHRKLGKGTVTYIGTDTDEGKLELDLITKIISKFEAPFNNLKGQTVLPDGLFIENRNGINVAINYAEAPAKVEVPVGAKVLLGKVELKQGEVVVWE